MNKGGKLQKTLQAIPSKDIKGLKLYVKKIFGDKSPRHRIFLYALKTQGEEYQHALQGLVDEGAIKDSTLNKDCTHVLSAVEDFCILQELKKDKNERDAILMAYAARNSVKPLLAPAERSLRRGIGTIHTPRTREPDLLQLLARTYTIQRHFDLKTGGSSEAIQIDALQNTIGEAYYNFALLYICAGIKEKRIRSFNELSPQDKDLMRFLSNEEHTLHLHSRDVIQFLIRLINLFLAEEAPAHVNIEWVTEQLDFFHQNKLLSKNSIKNHFSLLSTAINHLAGVFPGQMYKKHKWPLYQWQLKNGYYKIDNIIRDTNFIDAFFSWAGYHMNVPLPSNEPLFIEDKKITIIEFADLLPAHEKEQGKALIKLTLELIMTYLEDFSPKRDKELMQWMVDIETNRTLRSHLDIIYYLFSLLGLVKVIYSAKSAGDEKFIEYEEQFKNQSKWFDSKLRKGITGVKPAFIDKLRMAIMAFRSLVTCMNNPDKKASLEKDWVPIHSLMLDLWIDRMRKKLGH